MIIIIMIANSYNINDNNNNIDNNDKNYKNNGNIEDKQQ